MADISEYDDILDSLEDDYTIGAEGEDAISPTLQAWSNATDVEELDLELLDISSESDFSFIDPLDSAVTATRNGTAPMLSTLSQFTTILSTTGVHGPRLLKAANLNTRAEQIGSGSQFTVFKDPVFEGQVIKRVKVPLSSRAEQRFAGSIDYRRQLKTLELELLSLCNPKLRSHPNIISLLAWGFDYPYADMAVPILFMEAADSPLGDFLGEPRTVEIKYQLALDITNGLEALHNLNIIHGDVKPDNVLVLAGPSDKVPFRAKLSDFGVCVDLETPHSKFSLDDYRGTPVWLAPEVTSGDVSMFGGFSTDLMFKFDAYSLGAVLFSLFIENGGEVALGKSHEKRLEKVTGSLNSATEIPSTLRIQLKKAVLSLLSEDPRNRPELSSSLLKSDLDAYKFWMSSINSIPSAKNHGIIDPIYNKGPLFWYRLDESIRTELEKQHTLSKGSGMPAFDGNVLFGIAQTITGQKPSYLDRMLDYIGDAARKGFSPARAVYAQIMKAHDLEAEFSEEVLEGWLLQSVSEGYFFSEPRASLEKIEMARRRFRDTGGFCNDPFLQKKDVKEAVIGDRVLDWRDKEGDIVDRKGNTLLHAAAALGCVDTVRTLLEKADSTVDPRNDNSETPLYKAFQAGHVEVIRILLDHGADASIQNSQRISPLHWLFVLPDEKMERIAIRMTDMGADVNAVIKPTIKEGSGGFTEKIQILHYPFELPLGTPLHWASSFRNMKAIETLLSLKANVNATYYDSDPSTTPLWFAAYYGDPQVVELLLHHGADVTLLGPKNRNAFHGITKYFPDQHGYLRHHWHYWIRHGCWKSHLETMTQVCRLLTAAGVDINAKETSYVAMTPIAAAADLGVWDGGTISALLANGADLTDSKVSAGDTVLHCWASIIGPRLDYPESYLPVLKEIANSMPTVDVVNKFDTDTPLHLLASTYHSEEEFEAACDIFLGHQPPANINAKNNRGLTPLAIALENDIAPEERGKYLLRKGASPILLNSRGRDVFYEIAKNAHLNDQASHDLVQHILETIGPNIQDAYKVNFLDHPKSYESLFAAAESSKLLTVRLLLSLGLAEKVNSLDENKSPPWTCLDQALHSAEIRRRAHVEGLASYKAGAPRKNAIEQDLVYGSHQGPPKRAAEAWRCFPDVIRCLRDAGAKRACEISGIPDGDYIEQPGDWDKENLDSYGYTKESQPNAEGWQVLYELAQYKSRGWLDKLWKYGKGK